MHKKNLIKFYLCLMSCAVMLSTTTVSAYGFESDLILPEDDPVIMESIIPEENISDSADDTDDIVEDVTVENTKDGVDAAAESTIEEISEEDTEDIELNEDVNLVSETENILVDEDNSQIYLNVETDNNENIVLSADYIDGYIGLDNLNDGIECVGIPAFTDSVYVSGGNCESEVIAEDGASVTTIDVKFEQKDARKMLDLVNSFRTSKTWYWNSDNKTKTTVSGLSPLRYDYNLEKIAMQRAAEIAYNLAERGRFEHDRPNGSRCFTVYDDASYYYGSAGENIAAGYSTKESVFTAWREDSDDYYGQGHRRNMLNENFTNFAVGHCTYKGRQYWVQLFTGTSSKSVGSSQWADGIDNASVKIYTSGNGPINILKILLGWVQGVDGKMYYESANQAVVNRFIKIDGYWYRFDGNGIMITGWKKLGGNWYHFASDGKMQTSWQKIGNYWFHFTSNGIMQTGWQKLGGNWYRFASNGTMLTGWQKIGDNWHHFTSKGIMQTGWQKLGGEWFYFSTKGYMLRSWQKIDGYWYHFTPKGYMQTGWQKVGNYWYCFGTNGKMIVDTWIGTRHVNSKGIWDKSR